MSTLDVVEHLRNLAAEPQNRATIVKVNSIFPSQLVHNRVDPFDITYIDRNANR